MAASPSDFPAARYSRREEDLWASPQYSRHPGPRAAATILMQVPIRIYGNDSQARKFEEATATLAINAAMGAGDDAGAVTSGSKVRCSTI